jgi:uncharacterized membrane protein YfcA
VLIQPWLTKRLGVRANQPAHGGPLLALGILATGIYGGYFGAAQGVLMIAVIALGTGESMQRSNAAKNVLAGVVNGVAAIVFILVAEVDWAVAGLIGIGSIIGGFLGGSLGRRIPSPVLRGLVVAIGILAVVTLVR